MKLSNAWIKDTAITAILLEDDEAKVWIGDTHTIDVHGEEDLREVRDWIDMVDNNG